MTVDKYAVFGNPIEQSKSPIIHLAFAKQTQQQMDYQKLLAPLAGFSQTLTDFFADSNAKGCNITAPFKQEAAKWVNELSASAKIAGAVNTIIRRPDNYFIGDNTDGFGLIADLKSQHVVLEGKRILLLGAGGAARGVIKPIIDQKPFELVVANRTKQNAVDLSNLVADANARGIALCEIDNANPFDIIINSTSASLSNELPAISDIILGNANVVYDMVYAAKPTPFLAHAKRLGVPVTLDGLGMLVGQAAQSFYLWRGVKPETLDVLNTLRAQL